MTLRRLRLPAVVATAATAVLLLAPAASAHVRVIPDSTTAGGYSVLTFRVPNESPTASTIAVTVDLPTDTPLSYVAVQPVPGWSAQVVTETLPEPVEVNGATLTQAPVRVEWTAEDGGVSDGEFQQFQISTGPLPEAGTELVLPAHQRYGDGTVVDWDQLSEDGTEPEYPAPALTTTAADESATESPATAPTAAATEDATPEPTASQPSTTTAAPDTLGRWLGSLGLLAGLAALALTLTRTTRRR